MKKPLHPRQTDDKLTVEYDQEDFEGALPNLAKELFNKSSNARLPINAVKHDIDDENYDEAAALEEGEDYLASEDEEEPSMSDHTSELTEEEAIQAKKKLYEKVKEREEYIRAQGDNLEDKELYNPGAVDFLRRCNTLQEAYEILNYLEKRNEITGQEKSDLIVKLEKDGLRGLGTKKTWGYFERKYRKDLPNMDEPLE